MPQHIEDGDNAAASLVVLLQTVKLEIDVREVIQVVSNVLILKNKKPRRIWLGMRARKFKIWMNKWFCYLEVISWKVRDYPEPRSPNRTACNHDRRSPQNESDGTQFSKFHCKRIQKTPSKAIHGYYSWPGKIESFVTTVLQTFQLWISTSTAFNTSPLWRYCTRSSRGGIDEGCNYVIYWI